MKTPENMKKAPAGRLPREEIELTRSFLPPLEELLPHLERIWSTKRLSNAGPLHRQFEEELARYLGTGPVALCANGSFALLAALDALEIGGEVVTTPFSFVATAHALHWKGIRPVFADIDPHTLTLDPARVEAAITPRTTAIVGVHLFGQPCFIDALQKIADRHRLKVIYDAAHAFGVRDAGGSILRHGDLSITSFHASKVFTTFEGGAVVCPTAEIYQRVHRFRNFGLGEDGALDGVGFNGKMNEFQAALGLVQLAHVDAALARRREIDLLYRQRLAHLPGLRMVAVPGVLQRNCGFFPVLIGGEGAEGAARRDEVFRRLTQEGIMARRYFHPLVSSLSPYCALPSAAAGNLPVANRIADRILCLPIHPELSPASIDFIAGRIEEILHDV